MNYPFSGTIPNIKLDSTGIDVKVKDIIRLVCQKNGITLDEIHIRTRKKEIVGARQEAMYLIYKMNNHLSLNFIGKRVFSKYNHSSVINSIRVTQDRIDTEQHTRNKIEEIIGLLYGHNSIFFTNIYS